jgi:outer membrane protein assembly factor BamB
MVFVLAVFLACLTLANCASPAAGTVKWKRSFGIDPDSGGTRGDILLSYDEKAIYFDSSEMGITAARVEDGAVLWNSSKYSRSWGSLSQSHDGKVLYSTSDVSDDEIFAFALSTVDGTLIWKSENFSKKWEYLMMDGPTALSPDGATLYIGCFGMGSPVFALTSSEGKLLWTQNTTSPDDEGQATAQGVVPSPDGKLVYCSSDDNSDSSITAFRATDGVLQWRFFGGGYFDGTMAISPDETTLYATSSDTAYAVRASDGKQLWNFSFAEDFTGKAHPPFNTEPGKSAGRSVLALSPDGSTVYMGLNTQWRPAGSIPSGVYALRTTDGKPVWKLEAGDDENGVEGSLTVSPNGKILYFGSTGNMAYAVNALDGEKIWTVATENPSHPGGWDPIYSGVVLSFDGSVVYFASDARVYAVFTGAAETTYWCVNSQCVPAPAGLPWPKCHPNCS